jgi:pimeloyl-ACP methyl ester carboxylesterase
MIAHISCRSNSKQKQNRKTMKMVISKDRTKIAYDKIGQGPAIILVNGALATRSDHTELAQLLAPHLTVYNYDRRGRDNSEDNQQYMVGREMEDIDALIEEAGGSAYVYGISSGACLALEAAATLGDKVKKLALYEAPYDEAEGAGEKWKEFKTKFDQFIAKDRLGDAVELHMKFIGVKDEMIAGMKDSPTWLRFESLARTLAYDIAAVGKDRSIPVERASKLKTITLVMAGGASLEAMPFMRATAEKLTKVMQNGRLRIIEGQGHDLNSKALAPILIEFFVMN